MAVGAGKGGLREGTKGGGGGLRDEDMRGRGGSLADADGGLNSLLEEGKGDLREEGKGGCSRGQAPLVPDLTGVYILGPSAASSTDGGATPRPPVKIEFFRKEKNRARFSEGKGNESTKDCEGKATAGGLGTRVDLFKGFRVLPLGFKKSSQEEVSSKIKALGGTLATLEECDKATHVCLGNSVDKKIITENWVYLCYDEATEGNMMVTSADSKPRRTTERMNPDNKVRRKLFPVSGADIDEEKIRRVYHQLFQCSNDETELVTLAAYASEMRKSLIISDLCPGTKRRGFHTTTLLELKLICREIYLLLKSLKKAGYTLAGNFSSKNFVVTKRVFGKGVLFGNLEKDSLQLISATGESFDEKSFKRMILSLFPKKMLPPHDIVTWLALVGHKDLEGLLINHWTLLEEQDARERFLYLSDKLLDMRKNADTKEVYTRIVKRLEERGGYDKWQDIIDGASGNDYLKKTLNRADPGTNRNQHYRKDVGGLLKLLRNCRHHYAKHEAEKFLIIIADNFPNLVSDFQEEMYKEGFYA